MRRFLRLLVHLVGRMLLRFARALGGVRLAALLAAHHAANAVREKHTAGHTGRCRHCAAKEAPATALLLHRRALAERSGALLAPRRSTALRLVIARRLTPRTAAARLFAASAATKQTAEEA